MSGDTMNPAGETPRPVVGKGSMWASALFTAAGVACVAGLLWAVNARLDRWDVQWFVLLIYGAAVSAVASSLLCLRGMRAGASDSDLAAGPRRLLWAAVIVTFLWVWFPPVERLVGWWIRMVSWYKFG